MSFGGRIAAVIHSRATSPLRRPHLNAPPSGPRALGPGIWDVRTQTCKRKYDCKASVNALALHCNQGEILSGDQNGLIRLWGQGVPADHRNVHRTVPG